MTPRGHEVFIEEVGQSKLTSEFRTTRSTYLRLWSNVTIPVLYLCSICRELCNCEDRNTHIRKHVTEFGTNGELFELAKRGVMGVGLGIGFEIEIELLQLMHWDSVLGFTVFGFYAKIQNLMNDNIAFSLSVVLKERRDGF